MIYFIWGKSNGQTLVSLIYYLFQSKSFFIIYLWDKSLIGYYKPNSNSFFISSSSKGRGQVIISEKEKGNRGWMSHVSLTLVQCRVASGLPPYDMHTTLRKEPALTSSFSNPMITGGCGGTEWSEWRVTTSIDRSLNHSYVFACIAARLTGFLRRNE